MYDLDDFDFGVHMSRDERDSISWEAVEKEEGCVYQPYGEGGVGDVGWIRTIYMCVLCLILKLNLDAFNGCSLIRTIVSS